MAADLSEADRRKKEVESATQTFGAEVESTIRGLGSSVSLSEAQSQIKSSAQKLVNSFNQNLAPIDCG